MDYHEPMHAVVELKRPDNRRTKEDEEEIKDRIEVYAARARMQLPLFPGRET